MVWNVGVYAAVKFVHILLAALWLGGSFYAGVVLGGFLPAATPLTRRELVSRFMPRSLKFGNVVGGLTVLSGLLLLHGELGYRGLAWGNFWEDPWGKFVAFGLVMSLLALYLLNFSARPSLRAILKILPDVPPDQPPPPNFAFLMNRLRFSGMLALVILLLALGAMVVANAYFG